MPLAFEAFRALNQPLYLTYAKAHLPEDAAAQATVQTAFRLILERWDHVVSQPRPAREAWSELIRCTGSREHPLPVPAESALQYDTVILHQLGKHSAEAIAQATGLDIPKVRYLTGLTPPVLHG
ncbi:hypothetical protein [Streptomyces sp. NBC_01565]|uniref:hypothetical protein n=1 Tax=Streptomyces sp. NBC_01565 TaxID=2975881 RepID=UPI002258B9F7|nr:hypothetical protein [Streptomyces sp. NBC_01565]MCX4546684.1 hypothetical protein [Streptomyces sp. NBC_01565]